MRASPTSSSKLLTLRGDDLGRTAAVMSSQILIYGNSRQSRQGNLKNLPQSQIQDFPKEGARFRVKCHVDAIQWGGG